MKTITLTQPWATLVAIGAKRIETRSWSTSYRGPLAIHAAKGPGAHGWMQLQHMCRNVDPFASTLAHLIEGEHVADRLPLGAVVAVAELVDCVPLWADRMTASRSMPRTIGRHRDDGEPVLWELTAQEIAFGDYTPGRFGWLLDNVRPLAAPVMARGALGLWNWEPPHTLDQLLLPPA
jgi:hypothetical protein